MKMKSLSPSWKMVSVPFVLFLLEHFQAFLSSSLLLLCGSARFYKLSSYLSLLLAFPGLLLLGQLKTYVTLWDLNFEVKSGSKPSLESSPSFTLGRNILQSGKSVVGFQPEQGLSAQNGRERKQSQWAVLCRRLVIAKRGRRPYLKLIQSYFTL